MKARFGTLLAIAVLLAALVAGVGPAGAQSGAPTVVSYQGQVVVDGTPYTGTGYFKFAIVDQLGMATYWSNDGTSTGGGEPASPVSLPVANGLFNVLLGDTSLANMIALPASAFDGTDRALRVWFGASEAKFDLLIPDRRIAAAPYALQAEEALTAVSARDADTVDAKHADDFAASAHDHDAAYVNEAQTGSVTSDMIVNGTIARADIGQNGCTNGQVLQWSGSAWVCATAGGVTDHGALTGLADDDHPQYFSLAQAEEVTGIPAFNGGTTGSSAPFSVDSTFRVSGLNADLLDGLEASAFALAGHTHEGTFWLQGGNSFGAVGTLGTNDNQALELEVNNARALRLEPNAYSPNLIGGYSGNTVTAGAFGATIAGGGSSGYLNRVTDDYGTVGGGSDNQAGDNAGDPWDREHNTVAGGYSNAATGMMTTIGGGGENTASGSYATVGGGIYNTASGDYAAIAAGVQNTAAGEASAVGGGEWNSAPGSFATVPGGLYNVAQGTYSFAAGRRAKANLAGCFVWADATDSDFNCTTGNQFAVRAMGGVNVQTGSATFQVNGGTVWTAGNDGAASGLDADLLDGVQGSAYQQRVSGDCTAGSTIRAVNADGTVVCEAHDARPVFAQTAVDTTGNVGRYASLTIGADGLPVLAYFDYDNNDLKVVHCGDLACTAGNTITTVDTAPDAGYYASMAIGSDGLPVITYFVGGVGGWLSLAHCGDAACTSGNYITAIDASVVSGPTSIAIGVDGWPVISYLDGGTHQDLRVVHCANVLCSSRSYSNVDSAGDVGDFNSITIGSDGLPLISYRDSTNWDLKVAHCGNASCSSGNSLHIVDSAGNAGYFTSITIGADGLPVVSYNDHYTLKVAHCGDIACAAGNTVTTVDTYGTAGWWTSITIGQDALPVVSYQDAYNDTLRVLHCGTPACTGGNTISVVDQEGSVGEYTSITIGADDLPVIGYYAYGAGDLKVTHCSNVFCVPYWRRR